MKIYFQTLGCEMPIDEMTAIISAFLPADMARLLNKVRILRYCVGVANMPGCGRCNLVDSCKNNVFAPRFSLGVFLWKFWFCVGIICLNLAGIPLDSMWI